MRTASRGLLFGVERHRVLSELVQEFRRCGWVGGLLLGVSVGGDAGRGQTLIVWATAEGRAAAAAIDAHLMGSTNLPAPIPPTARPLVV